MLRLKIARRAEKFLSKLPAKQKNQIAIKIKYLQQTGQTSDSIRLKGSLWYRVDIGEYRIIYGIEEDWLVIHLVGKRNDDEVYKKLNRLE